MNYEDLTPEQMEKVKACKSAEELIELAKAEGVELTDEQFESISGGEAWYECPNYERGPVLRRVM